MRTWLRRPRRVQSWLRWMVLGCTLPALAMAVFLIMRGYQAQREDLEQGTIATARALMQAIDRELVGMQAALAILAASPDLRQGELAAFHARTLALLPDMTFSNLVLTDTDGQQLLNTLRAYGTQLPRHANSELVRQAVETRRSVISDLYLGSRANQHIVGVAMPVPVGGRVAYVLTAGVYTDRLAEMLRRQNLPRGWYASVLDNAGTIVARSSDHAQLSGRQASAPFRARIATSSEGVMDAVTRAGEAVFASFSRSPLSGWTVVIGIPQADLTSDLQASLWLGITVASALVLLALIWASAIGGHIGRSIEVLKAPARALASSHRPEMPRSGMAEVAEVGAALVRTWDLLEQRSFDRARAEAEEEEAMRRLTERSAELERSNAELEQFAYAAAHDLKSPLGAIAHLAGWIEQDLEAGSEQEVASNLSLLRGRVARMQSLLDGLLAYAHVGRGMEHEDVDTASLVHNIAAITQRPGFVVTCTAPMPMLHTDRASLERVLSILIANGLQHHDRPGGRVEVSARLHDGMAEFRVQDDGPGIAPRFQKRIFGIFQTLQSRDDLESSGVGLAIAMKKVVAHGGHIWVESSPPARGTCFVFTWRDG